MCFAVVLECILDCISRTPYYFISCTHYSPCSAQQPPALLYFPF